MDKEILSIIECLSAVTGRLKRCPWIVASSYMNVQPVTLS